MIIVLMLQCGNDKESVLENVRKSVKRVSQIKNESTFALSYLKRHDIRYGALSRFHHTIGLSIVTCLR